MLDPTQLAFRQGPLLSLGMDQKISSSLKKNVIRLHKVLGGAYERRGAEGGRDE